MIATALALLVVAGAFGRRAEAVTGDPWVQRAALSDPAAGSNGGVGEHVAISARTAVVSAQSANGGKGELLVYTRPASGWANATHPTAILTASDGASGDQFGGAVAVSGDTIVVGAANHEVGTNAGEGAAYVFVKPTSGWHDATENAELIAFGGAPGDHLASSVAIDGGTIVAGAPNRGFGATTQAGTALVWVEPAAGWSGSLTQDAVLAPVTAATNDSFGISVGVSGSTVVVGSDGHANGGAAYVFKKPRTGWSGTVNPAATLTASDAAEGDSLGAAVAIDDSTVVAGAPLHAVGSISHEGAAYVYVKPASGWKSATQTAELTESDAQPNNGFGGQVAISDSEVVAGSPGGGVLGSRAVGSAYVFVEPAAGWSGTQSQSAEFDGPAAANDLFGAGVATSGASVLVGAPGLASAYLFDPGVTATIAAPANSAAYTLGQQVIASYTCSASAPATLRSCTGPVLNGAPIDTSTLGAHTFTVTAAASDHETATQTVTYTVAPAPPPLPVLGPIRVSHKTFRLGSRRTSIASIAAGHRRRPPIGTRFTTTLNTAATLTLTFTPRTKHRRRTAASLTLRGHAGTDGIRFQGRVSRHRKLKPGRYTLTIVASNSAGSSRARSVTFTIVRG